MTSFLENEAGDREELDDAAAGLPVLLVWLGLACRKVFVAAEGLTEGWKQIFLRGGDPAPDSDMLAVRSQDQINGHLLSFHIL